MFYDRYEAGRQLASFLQKYKGYPNTIVLGLARGGIVVAFELAKALSLSLNVLVPRKIGAPGNPELAIGAIMDGETIFNDDLIRILNVSPSYIAKETEKEKSKAQQRLTLYRQSTPLPNLKDYRVILVDDGIATGATMLVAIKAMRSLQVQRIIVAVPVAASDTLSLIQKAADEVVCIISRSDFIGVSYYYKNFQQTEDAEVIHLLKEANEG